MKHDSRARPRPSLRHHVLPAAVLLFLLAAVGAGIFLKTLQAVAPPVYDAMSYYVKAASVWRALDQRWRVNPLNVEPVVRPPGVIVLSGPVGFSPDFRWFFFRTTVLPILLLAGACWLVARERMRTPRERWSAVAVLAALLSLPMFYHFEPSDILPVAAYWGLVDPFFAGVAALATALLLVGARRRSVAITVCGTLLGAFTLLLKPAGLVVIPVIFWAWFVEALIVSWPVSVSWRRDARFRGYVLASGAMMAVVLGVTAVACFRSRYLSGETIRFFVNSQRILMEMYRGASLPGLIAGHVHPWLGWHWAALLALSVCAATIRVARRAVLRRLDGGDARFVAGLVALGGAVGWWVWFGGPSEGRYVLPFVLIFIVILLPTVLAQAATVPAWAWRWCGGALAAPLLLLILLLWADRPAPVLQRLLGVTLATGQFREEVQVGTLVADAARAQKRELSVYAVEVDGGHGVVEAVGEHRRLLERNAPVFRMRGPIDWRTAPLIRRYELLASDYIVFRPMLDAPEAQQWETAERIDGFDGEVRAVRAWLTRAGRSDGLDVVYDGPLRLVRVVDLAAADRSFGSLVARHAWRPVFAEENRAAVAMSPADIERMRANSAPGARRVQFDGKFMLHGARVTGRDGALRMDLLWEGLAAEPANWWVFVHLLDGAGRIVSQADYPFRATVRRGLLWQDQVVLSKEQLVGARRIAVGIYQPTGPVLSAAGGERDSSNTRVLIALP